MCGCNSQKREDYYSLYVDDYLVTVGYDNCDYLDVTYKYDAKDNFLENETVKDIKLYLNGKLFGIADLSNPTNKAIDKKDAVITKLVLYFNDLANRKFKIDNIELDTSIKTNCETFNGKYIDKNGRACVIEKNVNDKLNVIELHGDYLDMDVDKIDHIVIYVE